MKGEILFRRQTQKRARLRVQVPGSCSGTGERQGKEQPSFTQAYKASAQGTAEEDVTSHECSGDQACHPCIYMEKSSEESNGRQLLCDNGDQHPETG